MALSASCLSGFTGPESRRSKRASEIWSITGDGAATTISITPRYAKRPKAVIGAVSYDVTSDITVAALTTLTTLGNGKIIAVEISGEL